MEGIVRVRANKCKVSVTVGKHKLWTRARRCKLGARVGKYKLGGRAGKYKLGVRVKARGREKQTPLFCSSEAKSEKSLVKS